MKDLEIRKATLGDVDRLQQIGQQTFYETFAAVNSEANMHKYLEESFSRQKLTDELNDPQASFYFAMLGQEVIGYVKLNFGGSQTALQDPDAVEIERIYVSSAYQGKKIGQALYQKALAIAREKNASYVWLGVWEHNQKAIRFYNKNGFVAFSAHSFWLGDDEQTDIMMKLLLD